MSRNTQIYVVTTILQIFVSSISNIHIWFISGEGRIKNLLFFSQKLNKYATKSMHILALPDAVLHHILQLVGDFDQLIELRRVCKRIAAIICAKTVTGYYVRH